MQAEPLEFYSVKMYLRMVNHSTICLIFSFITFWWLIAFWKDEAGGDLKIAPCFGVLILFF